MTTPRVRWEDQNVGMSRYQKILVFFLVFTVPLRTISLLEVPGANLRIGDIVIVAGLVIAHANWLLSPTPRRFRFLDWVLGAFVLLCLVSIAWSLDATFGLARSFKYARNLVFYLLLVQCLDRDVRTGYRLVAAGVVASFVYIIPVTIYSLAKTTTLDLSVLVGVGLASSSALDELRTVAIGGATLGGTINDLARWATIAFLLLLGTGFWTAPGRIVRWGSWAAAAAILGVDAVTFSRGAWMGLAVGLAWWGLRLRGGMRLSITTRIVLVIAVAVCVSWMIAHGLDTLLLARVRSSSDIQGDVAIADRLTLWRMAVSAFLSHPLTGVGMGGGTVIAAATGVRDWYVHNVYLQIIFELGVLGALIWGTVVCSWMWSSFRVRLGPLTWKDQVIAVAIQASVLALLTSGLTGTDFTEQEYWIMLALGSCIHRLLSTHPNQLPSQIVQHNPLRSRDA